MIRRLGEATEKGIGLVFAVMCGLLLAVGCSQESLPEPVKNDVSRDKGTAALQAMTNAVSPQATVNGAQAKTEPVTSLAATNSFPEKAKSVSSPAAKNTAPVKAISVPLSATNVVIDVNGEKVTKAEYERYIKMLHALFCQRNPKADDKRKKAMLAKIRKGAARPIIQRLVVRTKLAGEKAQDLPEVRSRIEKEDVRMFGGKGKSFADVRKAVVAQGFADLFDRDFALDVKLNSVFATTYSNELTVTAAELAKVKQNVMDYNKRAAATNALQEAHGREIVKEARKGKIDFATLADKYSQDEEKEKGGAMGECIAADFESESPVYWETLTRMKEGSITDLIMTSEGYEIVRVNKKIKPDDSQSGESALDLSRIFLRRAYSFPEQSEEDFRDDVIQEKREKFFKEFLVKLVKSSKISYPSGPKALR